MKNFVRITLGFLTLCCLALLIGVSQPANAQTDSFEYKIEYQFDRSSLPTLPNDEITFNIAVGQVIDFRLEDQDEEVVEGVLDEALGVLSVTTSAESLTLSLITETDNPLIGSFGIATLKDNKQWAWSHGLDDNNELSETIAFFERREWSGTLFLIGRQVETSFNLTDGISEARAVELVNRGWSLGNHSYAHEDCDPLEERTEEEEILAGQAVLERIVTLSERPEYTPIALAAPCFLPGYQPALENIQESRETSLLFNETDNRFVLRVDPGITSDEELANGVIYAFDPTLPIGRDGTVDQFSVDDAIQTVDWVARQSDSGKHLWYNSLSHGPSIFLGNEGVENRVNQLIEHIYREYGPWGSDEVWVAPSDQIYSYILLRDGIDIEIVDIDRDGFAYDESEAMQLLPDELSGLESIEILPTRVRPVDTPIPILKLATQVPVVDPTATPEPVVITDTIGIEGEGEVAMVANDAAVVNPSAVQTPSALFNSLGILAWLLLVVSFMTILIALVLSVLLLIRYRQLRRRG